MAYFVVNSTWKKKDGDKVKVNKVDYEFGKNAFADIKTLLAKVQTDEKATADLKVMQIEALVDAYVKANEAVESFVKPTFDATNTKAAYYENNKAAVDAANVTATEALVDAYVKANEAVEGFEKPVFDETNTKAEYYAANEEAIDKWNNGWVDALVDAYVDANKAVTGFVNPTFDETNTKAAYYKANKKAVDTWNTAKGADKLRDAAMTDGIVLVDTTAEAIEIDVVGGKVVLDKTSLDEATLKYFADREINIDADGKSSLEVNGVVLPEDWDIEDVADVKIVEGGAVEGDITFEADKQTEYKYGKGDTVTTSLKSESIAAGGKIEIASKGYQVEVTEGGKKDTVDKPAAAEIEGYKTVNVKAGAYAGKISADEFSAKYAELDDKKKFAIDWNNVGEITDKDGNVTGDDYNYDETKGLMTEAKVTATGTVTLEKEAVAESIYGYKTVKLQEGAEVKGNVYSYAGKYDVGNANAVVIEDVKNADGVKTGEDFVVQDWAGDREVAELGGYTEVKIADKAVFEDKNVKGNTTITKKAAYNGQFTADEAAVERAVTNFATVKATDSVIKGGAYVGATESVTEKYTYKTTKVKEASVYSAAYDYNSKSSAVGSFTATGSTFGVKGVEGVADDLTTPEDETVKAVTPVDGSIDGYKTVKLTGSSIVNGNITGELNTSTVEKYESVPGKLVNAGGTTYEQKTVKEQAVNDDGSLKFEADGVTPVMVDKQVDDYTKPIYGALSFAEDPTGIHNIGISKKVSSTWKSAADGSVTVAVDKKNAADVEIAGSITDYAKVTLTGAAEKIVKVGGSVKSAVTENDTFKDTTVFEEGNVKGNKNETWKDTYAGNFTATAAEVGGAVENFATVKVTDSVVKGSISVGKNSNTTEKYGYKTIKGKGEAPATYSATYDKTTKTSAVGSVTIADSTIGVFGVADDPKTTDKNEYVADQKANIKGFKTVKLTNTSVNGAIEGTLLSTTNDKYESAKLINVGETTYEQKTKMIPKVEDGVPVYVQEQAKDAEGNLLWVDEAKTVPQMTNKLDKYGDPIPVMVEEKDANGNVVTEDDYTKPIYGVASFAADGTVDGISKRVSWNSKTAAEGSVTVAVARKDAKEVVIGGNITNYLNVTLTGAVDKKSGAKTLVKVNGSVTGSETETSVGNDKIGFDDDARIVKGSFTNNVKDVAAGTFKAVAAEISGKIAGFKTVTLDNSVVTGSNGYDGIEADLNNSMVWKDTAKWKKGAAEGSVDMQFTETKSAVASLTATNSTIGVFAVADDPKTEDVNETVVAQNANISGFKTVKLTNTSVNGSITGASNDKTVNKTVMNFASYEDAKNDKAKTREFESVVTNKADGKVTFKVDKNAAEDLYQVGAISEYKDVDIAGIAIKGKTKDDPTTIKSVVVKGNISADANFERKRKYVVTPGYDKDGNYDYTGEFTTTDYDDDAKKLNFDKSTAVGSLKLAYADVEGGIYNFAKVTLTDSAVDGDVTTGYNTVKTYDWAEFVPAVNDDPATTDVDEAKDAVNAHEVALTDYNSVVGSLSMTNVDIDGQVSGFKTVDVKKGAEGFVNYFDSYKGLAVAEKDQVKDGLAATEKDAAETIKIAKGATLVTKYMELQKEDKLVVDGSVIFQGGVKPAAKAVVGTETAERYDIGAGAAEVTGNGTIYASDEGMKSIGESFKGTKVNLGTTAENFWGVDVEVADNEHSNEAFDTAFSGWLGKGFDCFDNDQKGDIVDWVAFERASSTATEGKSYVFKCEQFKFEAAEGATDEAIAEAKAAKLKEAYDVFTFTGVELNADKAANLSFNEDGYLVFTVAKAADEKDTALADVSIQLGSKASGSYSYTIVEAALA